MTNLLSQFRVSFLDLMKNKARTFLTTLGILVGVMAVVLLVAFGQGLKNYIVQQLEDLGSNTVYVYPGNVLEGGTRPGGGFLGGAEFDDRDVKSLGKVEGMKNLVPVFVRRSLVEARGEEELSDLYATTEGIFILRNLEAQAGRLFNAADEERGNKVVVLGPQLAEDLFGSIVGAVGQSVRISEQRFRVIGVVGSQGGGGLGGPQFDSYTYVPRRSARGLNPENRIFAFYLQAVDENSVGEVKDSAKRILLKRYDEEDFTVAEPSEFLEIIDSILGVMNGVLLSIGSISLLVGGIGIMNIMFANVNSRIKEVGIRRALGATKEDILILFLTEAVMLSLLGGLTGLILSGLIVLGVRPFFPVSLNLLAVLIGLGVSTGIGVFFGVWPAAKAANRSPIEAIGYE